MSDQVVEVYVCSPRGPSVFTDVIYGFCENPNCGCEIMMRPYAPKHMRKICWECAQREVQIEVAKGEEIITQPGSVLGPDGEFDSLCEKLGVSPEELNKWAKEKLLGKEV
jgi:hypothetical protein